MAIVCCTSTSKFFSWNCRAICIYFIWITLLESYVHCSNIKIDRNTNANIKKSQLPIDHEDRMRRSDNTYLINAPMVTALLPLTSGAVFDETGALAFPAYTKVKFRLIGFNLTSSTQVVFTTSPGENGDKCILSRLYTPYPVVIDQGTNNSSGIIELTWDTVGCTIYVCARRSIDDDWAHQGQQIWLNLKPFGIALPLFVKIIFLVLLLSLSGLFSGLNLGLMALDPTELQVVITAGNKKERRYAKVIEPIRRHGNYLLCTILLGNVLVNNTLTVLLDDITTGVIAVIGATIAIVIFGEIVPQSICSRYGLAIGARTIWLTKLFMILTAPLSYPLSCILDRILGAEIGRVYNREKLLKLLEITKKYNDIEKDEMQMISGVLNFKKKTVADVMTKYEDVFMLDIDSILDFDTIDKIYQSGHSRIPVYETDRSCVVSILHVKDLAFVDPDDKTPLRAIVEFHNRSVAWVHNDTSLDRMLEYFKTGVSHLVLIKTVVQVEDGDPVYNLLGVVTLEDVIEELIQCEIVDETDVYIDNRSRKPVPNRKNVIDLSMYRDTDAASLSPQQTLAVFRFLSSVVEPFYEEYISEVILKRLLKTAVFDLQIDETSQENRILYSKGKPADYFILIVEGKVSVTVGVESLTHEGGPFTFYGVSSLMKKSPDSTNNTSTHDAEQKNSSTSANSYFVPDYSIQAITSLLYVKITVSQYIVARRATGYERTNLSTRRTDSIDSNISKRSAAYSLTNRGIGSVGSNTNVKNYLENVIPKTHLVMKVSNEKLTKSSESIV